MSLKLVFGRSGSGKTMHCMKDMIAQNNPSILIVPEQFSFTAEKMLSGLTGVHGLGGIEVLSFKRLATRFLATYDGAAGRNIDAGGKAMLVYKILNTQKKNLTTLKSLAAERGAANEILKIISEFKRYNITPDFLDNICPKLPSSALKEKLSDLSIIYKGFENEINDKYIDRDDDLMRLSKGLEQTNYLKNINVYIDKFSSFTPSELLCIESFLKTSPAVTVTLCVLEDEMDKPEFAPPSITAKKLMNLARDLNVKIQRSETLTAKAYPKGSALYHLEKEYFSYPAKTYENKTDEIKLFTAKNPFYEVHFVAREILKLCREKGYYFRDIAIAGRDLEPYEKYIKTVFTEVGIKFFMDQKINILNHPVVIFLLSALEIIIKNYDYETVFRFLKSGFLRIPENDIDVLENYVLATGIRGSIWKNDERWNFRTTVYADHEELFETEAEELLIADRTRRKIVRPLIKLENDLKEGKTALAKCNALYDFLCFLKLPNRIEAMARLFERKGELYKAEEYRSIFNKIVEALDDVSDAFGEDKISIANFFEILRTGLGEYEIGLIPSEQDGVAVGSIGRLKGYNVKALFMVGVNDGVFPAVQTPTGILNDKDRNTLLNIGFEIAPDAAYKTFEEEHLIYNSLTIPSHHLFLSCSGSDNLGTALRPSQIMSRMLEIFPNIDRDNDLLGLSDEDKISSQNFAFENLILELREKNEVTGKLLEAYKWFSQNEEWNKRLNEILHIFTLKNRALNLSDETVQKFWGSEFRTSVSRLERYSSCPFSYFVQYTLNAKERKILKLGAMDAGSFLHGFIDEFSKRLPENNMSWHEVDEAYIDSEIEAIMSIMDRRLNRYILSTSPRYAHLFARLKTVIKRSVSLICEHIKRGSFQPMGYELSFGDNGDLKPLTITLPNGGKIKLTGRIDRVDLYKDSSGDTFVRIIDYKSGSKDFDISDVFHGLNIQLGVYMAAICENENDFLGKSVKPAAMLYFKLDDPVLKVSPGTEESEIERARLKELKLKGLVLNSETIVTEMDKGISGTSEFLPVKLGKDGVTGNSAVSMEQFDKLHRHIKSIVSKLSQELTSGKTDIYPYKKDKTMPCDFCNYKSICGFDMSNGTVRRIKKQKNDEIWAEILR